MNRYFSLSYLIIILLLTSCSYRSIGWHSDNSQGTSNVNFKYFNGKSIDTISLSTGSTLLLNYKTKLTAGKLKISVMLSKTPVWQKDSMLELDSSLLKLLIKKSGKYKIIIEGQKAAGCFELTYKEIRLKKIKVVTNKNIELFGLVMQIDMGKDLDNATDSVVIAGWKTTWRNWYIKSYKNYLKYKKFEDSKMMVLYRNNQNQGFYNDFYIGFLLQVDQVPYAKLNSGTSDETVLGFSKVGNLEAAKGDASKFLDQLNAFYKQINFSEYLNTNEKYYNIINADVKKNTPQDSFIPAMENFYQKSFRNYYLVPSLNIPTSMGFGKMNKSIETVYNVFGPFSFQDFDQKNLDLGFDHPDNIQGLSVHEFGHSFVNPAIDKIPDSLRKATEFLYLPIRDAMCKKAYTNWTMCLYEHFVKAGEIIIARNLGQFETANKLLNDNVNSNFIYLPLIVKELEKYNKHKEIYKSYDAYVLQVIEKLRYAYHQ